MNRPLIVVAHGTADERGISTLEDIARLAGEQVGAVTSLGYVDVCGPEAADVLSGAVAPVVVPLFLGGGYHVQVDVPEAAARAADATVTSHLGVDDLVADATVSRLREAGWVPDATVRQYVLVAAAGSRRASVRAEVEGLAALVAQRTNVETSAVYVTSAPDGLAARVAALVAEGAQVAVANLLIAPGWFNDKLLREARENGSSVVADPLGTHPSLIELLAQRYRSA